mmetsp:Transcript_41275/g.90044  ORF Transcript_41275/g.90044 Transcript_41275/m.90044 type:complete len:238 (-) Transcript_41275:54-767(-)
MSACTLRAAAMAEGRRALRGAVPWDTAGPAAPVAGTFSVLLAKVGAAGTGVLGALRCGVGPDADPDCAAAALGASAWDFGVAESPLRAALWTFGAVSLAFVAVTVVSEAVSVAFCAPALFLEMVPAAFGAAALACLSASGRGCTAAAEGVAGVCVGTGSSVANTWPAVPSASGLSAVLTRRRAGAPETLLASAASTCSTTATPAAVTCGMCESAAPTAHAKHNTPLMTMDTNVNCGH